MSPSANTLNNTVPKSDEAPASPTNEVEKKRAEAAADAEKSGGAAEKEQEKDEKGKEREEEKEVEEEGGDEDNPDDDVEMQGTSSSEEGDVPRARATPRKHGVPSATVSVLLPPLRMVTSERAQPPREKRKRAEAYGCWSCLWRNIDCEPSAGSGGSCAACATARCKCASTDSPPPDPKHRYYPRDGWQWDCAFPFWNGRKGSAHAEDFRDSSASAPRSSTRALPRARPAISAGAAPQPAGLQDFLTKAGKFMKFVGDFAERVDARDAELLEEMRAARVAAESGANDLRRLVELMEAQQGPGRYWQPGPPASEASTSDYFGSGRGRKSRSGGRKGAGGGGAGAEDSSGRGF
ncbi:hypothetical protein CC1G_14409 [Coprinopsis cinerea okayama7|uniref:Uncharacterized protein n=1 Tax=Coprinopsis cinerea (strain Okayama-7 / 130 / ATCC MYA-4618 / FGSC 9003) TaxID=240176 RepID=D6RMA5_COPC7|nr:hypothetical protein CC1G_14409 [Coprinopsis cinerea okayama7\|eukprot:XP_002911412.1 hypothetical protein CC1G_14409 [Coprinopsis cinerea okayama7\